MKNNIYDLWISKCEISNKVKLNLLENFSSEEIWNMTEKDFEKNKIDKKYFLKLQLEKNENNLEKYLNYMEKFNIKLISHKDNFYPQKLHNINNKPAYIYIRGNEKLLYEDNVAIVGSRNATDYGKNVARKFAKEIADKYVNVVSGLAIGIDKFAHLGALDSNKGKTIAVLGTGVADFEIYPFENKRIFERILENNGLIISEYVIGTKPVKYHFPERNRIISGISDKIIVVEATEKSGSLITVDYALSQGKDIFAVPGNIFSKSYQGTNNLIKEGAFLIDKVDDIFSF